MVEGSVSCVAARAGPVFGQYTLHYQAVHSTLGAVHSTLGSGQYTLYWRAVHSTLGSGHLTGHYRVD